MSYQIKPWRHDGKIVRKCNHCGSVLLQDAEPRADPLRDGVASFGMATMMEFYQSWYARDERTAMARTNQ